MACRVADGDGEDVGMLSGIQGLFSDSCHSDIAVEMKVLKLPGSFLPPPLTGPYREGDWLQDRIEVLRGGVRFQTQPWHVTEFQELRV